MTTYELSDRAKTIFTRLVSVVMDDMMREAKNLTQEELTNYFDRETEENALCKDWLFGIDLLAPTHEDGCEHDDIPIPFGETCDCDYEEERWWVGLHLRSPSGPRLLERKIISARGDDREKVIVKWIDWLAKEWKICSCGEKAIREGFCKECFIHNYTRTEEEGGDCVVCHENNGRWTKLECGHILHSHCWMKIVGSKCPLCREVSKKPCSDCYDK